MSENKSNLEKILEFSQLLNKFRNITRGVLVNGEDRWENDVEHSYMLAMLADYIISLENLNLDRHKIMMYALAHDIVEVYAGDTYAHSDDKSLHDSKKEREESALKKLKSEFPEHEEFFKYCDGYEKKEDDEAKLVYALDKLHPTVNIYLEDGRSWKERGVTLEKVLTYKGEKIKVSPTIEKYWNELLEILERNKSTLFPV